MKLCDVKVGQSAVITDISSSNPIVYRLVELGFSKNAVVKAIIAGMSGNITAYKVKNTVMALRKETAEFINVILISGENYG